MRHWIDEHPEITAHDVVTRAMHRSGSEQFGGLAWTDPLEVLTRALDREARLHHRGRRLARRRLVDLLVGRSEGSTPGPGQPPPATTTDPPRVVLVTGLPESGTDELVRRLVAGGASCLDGMSTFASAEFEVRWHVPTYAEWLTLADLRPTYAELADRAVTTAVPADAPMTVIAGWGHLEHLGAAAAAMPDSVVVVVRGDRDRAQDRLVRDCVEQRSISSRATDPDRIARYWGWRLDLIAERAEHAPTPATGAVIEIEAHQLVQDPDGVVASITQAARR